MAIEFTVRLENQPGTLAEFGAAMGKMGVNIDAIQGMPCDGIGVINFVADNPDAATEALTQAGLPFTSREVLVLNLLDQPGTLGDVALVMADAGINIDAVYATLKGKVVLGVDDLPGAMQVAGGMAVT